jgi:hypothetical protein
MSSRPLGLIASLILHAAPQRGGRVNISFGVKKTDFARPAASGAKRTFNELTMSVKCHFDLFADGRV